jgi:PAS domain S-box-containing protein
VGTFVSVGQLEDVLMARKPTYEELEQRLRELEQKSVDRRKAEDGLRKSEGRLKALTATTPTYIYEIDANGIITFVNRTYEDVTQEQVVGTKLVDWFPRDQHPFIQSLVKKVFSTGEPQEAEYTIPDPRGRLRSYIAAITPIRRKDQTTAAVLTATEITELKEAEMALKEERDNAQLYLDIAAVIIIAIDAKGEVKLINKKGCEVLGYKEEEIVGKNWFDNFLPERLRDTVKAVSHQLLAGEIEPAEYYENPILTKSGQERLIGWNNTVLRDEAGNIIGHLSSGTDITDRIKAEEEKNRLEAQLVQAQKMEAVGTLAGGIAHDFNNLLMAAQGNLSLMLYEIDSTHPHFEPLKNIEKQIKSGATLTSQLLGFARKGQYHVRPISLTELVEETSNAFGRTRKDTTIHRELADDLFAIEADQGQIEQVLLNLYVNATDAMPGGGELTLKTMNVTQKDMKGKLYDPKPGKYVLLMVTDTGAGMDKEMQERIFDPFFTTKEMSRGTGLGLASAYGIIKSHGGYIDVDSEEGKGATFSIYLPAKDKKVEKIVIVDEKIVKGTETILVVDDEAMVLDAAVKILEKLGYTVIEAKGGREALEIYEANKNKIDMVVLDMVMPDIGGGKAYDRMKEINPKVKVLLSSGYSIESEAKEILARGCDGFIQKPFSMRELSQGVREILGKD